MNTLLSNEKLSIKHKLKSALKAEVPYKSMGSEYGLSNKLPLKLRAGLLACHTLSMQKKSMASEMAWSGEL